LPTPKAQIRARPIRVAYLVEESEHWCPMLEAIFAECYGRWGGRFSLIVPCINGAIRSAYLPWLRACDPDLIYSYVDLPDSYVEHLHEFLYPAFLTLHRFHSAERDVYAFRPELPVKPLSSLSVSLVASRGNTITESQPVVLADIAPGTKPSRLLQENFGCYGASIGSWPLARDMRSHIRTLVVANEPAAAGPYGVADADLLSTELELLQRISKQRNIVGLAQMSAWLTPRFEISNPGWTGSASIILGDSFVDRITFWNGRSHFPAWLNSSIVALKLSFEDIEKPDIFNAILEIIKWRVHASGNSNSEQIVIRSASLSDVELEHDKISFVPRTRGIGFRLKSYIQ
jgi:hypothetical protein